jgi:hypothetical protein
MSMQASGIGHYGPEELERELRRSLYRFDCPDAHILGEYEIDAVEPQDRTRIAAHVTECDECQAELHTLRAFLVTPTTLPDTLAGRARRIVANLFSPAPGLAYGGLRGAADSLTRVYEAGEVTVTIGPGQTRGSLFGLVVAAGRSSEALKGCTIRLLPREGAPSTTALDDLGNFELTDLAAELYALEIELPDGVIVIEELRVD